MRLAFLGILCLSLFSCREYYPVEASIPVSGYRLSGKVISQNGIPLSNVAVSILYNYTWYSDTPLDTISIVITGSPKLMRVAVFTPENVLVKTLYATYPPQGTFANRYWNEKNDSGGNVPSGKYIIRYTYGTQIVKELPYIVESTTTATTDVNGNFILGNDALPIGELFDVYDVSTPGSYYGAYSIDAVAELVFSKGNLTTNADVDVLDNQITRGVFTLQ